MSVVIFWSGTELLAQPERQGFYNVKDPGKTDIRNSLHYLLMNAGIERRNKRKKSSLER